MNSTESILKLDLAVGSIHKRFDQKGFKTFCNVEQLLFKACAGESFDKELNAVCIFIYEDFIKDDLMAQLSTLHTLYCSVTDETPSVDSIKTALLTLSAPQ
jgi:hypothetical protein